MNPVGRGKLYISSVPFGLSVFYSIDFYVHSISLQITGGFFGGGDNLFKPEGLTPHPDKGASKSASDAITRANDNIFFIPKYLEHNLLFIRSLIITPESVYLKKKVWAEQQLARQGALVGHTIHDRQRNYKN